MNKIREQLTFRDGKEGNGSYRVPMSASDSIVRVANRQIEWMVLYMSSRYADCGLIAPKNNGAVHRSFGSWVRFEDIILFAHYNVSLLDQKKTEILTERRQATLPDITLFH